MHKTERGLDTPAMSVLGADGIWYRASAFLPGSPVFNRDDGPVRAFQPSTRTPETYRVPSPVPGPISGRTLA